MINFMSKLFKPDKTNIFCPYCKKEVTKEKTVYWHLARCFRGKTNDKKNIKRIK